MTGAERTLITSHPLLLYDGVCVLCNGVVRFVARWDAGQVFRFAPLESAIAKELLARASDLGEGVVLITETLTPEQRIFQRSDAVCRVLVILGGRWRLTGRLLAAVPRPLRELGYSAVARLRYKLFGRYETCPVPEPDLRRRMLF
ncbi:MAG: DCC1-like thiol-disulfide oxidoreductase family protein [Acidobacteriaceae bacterium]|nr:DCC1-like thiol-disulfide oxidoreductase family protein [Acidobacteriaceae bacterium]